MDRFPNSSELPEKMTNGAVTSLALQPNSEASQAKESLNKYLSRRLRTDL